MAAIFSEDIEDAVKEIATWMANLNTHLVLLHDTLGNLGDAVRDVNDSLRDIKDVLHKLPRPPKGKRARSI